MLRRYCLFTRVTGLAILLLPLFIGRMTCLRRSANGSPAGFTHPSTVPHHNAALESYALLLCATNSHDVIKKIQGLEGFAQSPSSLHHLRVLTFQLCSGAAALQRQLPFAQHRARVYSPMRWESLGSRSPPGRPLYDQLIARLRLECVATSDWRGTGLGSVVGTRSPRAGHRSASCRWSTASRRSMVAWRLGRSGPRTLLEPPRRPPSWMNYPPEDEHIGVEVACKAGREIYRGLDWTSDMSVSRETGRKSH